MKPVKSLQKLLRIVTNLLFLCCFVGLGYSQSIQNMDAHNLYYPEDTMAENETDELKAYKVVVAINTSGIKSEVFEVDNYTINSSINSLLAVEFERDIEVESWMLTPFKSAVTTQSIQNDIRTDIEKELELEVWMTDMNQWGYDSN